MFFTNEKQRKDLNRTMKKRGFEIAKYIVPENKTIGFALMVVPDLVYAILSPETYKKLSKAKVVPVDYGSLFSCIMIISKQIQIYQISQVIDDLGELNDFIDTQINTIKGYFQKASNQLNNANKNVQKAIQVTNDTHDRIKERMGLLELKN